MVVNRSAVLQPKEILRVWKRADCRVSSIEMTIVVLGRSLLSGYLDPYTATMKTLS